MDQFNMTATSKTTASTETTIASTLDGEGAAQQNVELSGEPTLDAAPGKGTDTNVMG